MIVVVVTVAYRRVVRFLDILADAALDEGINTHPASSPPKCLQIFFQITSKSYNLSLDLSNFILSATSQYPNS